MAKLPINPSLLLRRTVRVQVRKAAAVAGKEAVPPGGGKVAAAAEKKKDNYWMRNPKTGNWVPESQVGDHEIDPVEQREKLLPKKNMFSN